MSIFQSSPAQGIQGIQGIQGQGTLPAPRMISEPSGDISKSELATWRRGEKPAERPGALIYDGDLMTQPGIFYGIVTIVYYSNYGSFIVYMMF